MDNAQGTEAKVGGPSGQPSTEAGVSPAPGQTNQPAPSGEKDAGSVQPQQTQPFDQHPRFKELTRQNREYRKQLETLQNQFQQFQSNQMTRQTPQGPQISQEDESALERLFSMAFTSPKVAEMLREKLGVSKIGDLEKQVGQLSESWSGSQFKSEMRQIKDYVKSLGDIPGMAPEDVEDAINEAIETHPVYSQVGYQPGAAEAIFRHLYWDKVGELQERARNKKEIEQREALKRGQTQGAAQSGSQPKGRLSAEEMLKEAGGFAGIDFGR